MIANQDIIRYYENCDIDYELVWDLNNSLSMHYGYWDEKVKNLRKAFQRENEVLAERARIKESDLALDAGCGVGGSSIFLAKNIGCRVIGITLSRKQAETARQNAIKNNVDKKAIFKQMDFTKTNFKDNHFDVVWAIDSVCCCPDKEKFVQESYRILKKGGRLIMADWFATKKFDKDERMVMDKWLEGWCVNRLSRKSSFEKYLHNFKFKNISYSGINEKIMPSAKMLYIYSLLGVPLWKFGRLFGLTDDMRCENAKSCCLQYKTLKRNLWEYGIFYAEK